MKTANSGENKNSGMTWILWVLAGILVFGLIYVRAVYSDMTWLTVAVAVPLLGVLGVLAKENKNALRSRTAAYGLHSFITVILIVGIVGVVNFLSSKHPFKLDLTKNKIHTFSDQSVKLIKGLNRPIKAVLFGKMQDREKVRPILDNYKALSTNFEVEFVDPDREPTRAKTAGIKKYGTLQLIVGPKEFKVEDVTEEKVTNALIKLLKEKTTTLCSITGHGEKSFDQQTAEGYEAVKKAMENQAYEVKEINLLQDAKIPDTCDAIAIMGPTKAFFEPEIKILNSYLDNGGRALIAIDLNIKGGEYAPELASVLESWNVKPAQALIVDPLARLFGVDAAVPVVLSFSKQNAITKDFDRAQCPVPLVRPLEIIPGAPAGMNVQWIAQTNPKSWGVTDIKSLSTGQVKFVPGKDKNGPLTVAVAVEGKKKDSKATRNTRIVVFGSSGFASNNYSRFGNNLDLFLNSAAWAMEDESMISIHAKEEGPGRVELTQKTGTTIFLATVLFIPLGISAGGVGVWAVRRRL